MSGDGGDSWILRTVSFYLPLSHPARRLVLSIKPLCCRVEEDGRKCGKTVRTENVLQSQCSEQVELWRAGRQGMVPESGLLPGRPASIRSVLRSLLSVENMPFSASNHRTTSSGPGSRAPVD